MKIIKLISTKHKNKNDKNRMKDEHDKVKEGSSKLFHTGEVSLMCTGSPSSKDCP